MSSWLKDELQRKKAKLAALRAERSNPRKSDTSDTRLEDILKDLNLNQNPSLQSATNFNDPIDNDKENVSSLKAAKKPLTISNPQHLNIKPQEKISYSKDVQTASEEPENVQSFEDNSIINQNSVLHNFPHLDWEMTFDSEHLDFGASDCIFPNHLKSPLKVIREERELSDAAKLKLIQSEEMKSFTLKAATLMEKEFASQGALWKTYHGSSKIKLSNNDGIAKESRIFAHKKHSKGRRVQNIAMDPMRSGYCLASYSLMEGHLNDSPGLLLLWDLEGSNSVPVQVLNYNSEIMSVAFSPHDPNVIFSGTINGEIIVYDLRKNPNRPVLRSKLTEVGHTRSVFGLFPSRSSGSSQITSIGTDSVICKWSAYMLNKPIECIKLDDVGLNLNLTYKSADEIFIDGAETGKFLIGDAEGRVVRVDTLDHQKNPNMSSTKIHQGPITRIRINPNQKYFITAGLDFSCKVNRLNDMKTTVEIRDESFESFYGVDYYPFNNSVFAIANILNEISFWNLDVDTEIPTSQITLDNCRGILDLKFNPTGNILAVGDTSGNLNAFELNKDILENGTA